MLARADGRCQLHLPGVCTTAATEVHTVLPAPLWPGHAPTAPDRVTFRKPAPARVLAACAACNRRAGEESVPDPEPEPRGWW